MLGAVLGAVICCAATAMCYAGARCDATPGLKRRGSSCRVAASQGRPQRPGARRRHMAVSMRPLAAACMQVPALRCAAVHAELCMLRKYRGARGMHVACIQVAGAETGHWYGSKGKRTPGAHKHAPAVARAQLETSETQTQRCRSAAAAAAAVVSAAAAWPLLGIRCPSQTTGDATVAERHGAQSNRHHYPWTGSTEQHGSRWRLLKLRSRPARLASRGAPCAGGAQGRLNRRHNCHCPAVDLIGAMGWNAVPGESSAVMHIYPESAVFKEGV
eukprot:353972-Chlamydomonas_euryale.AAC.12